MKVASPVLRRGRASNRSFLFGEGVVKATPLLYRIKLAQKLGTLYSRYWETRKKARVWKVAGR